MPDTDPDGLLGEDLERDGRVGEGLGTEEDLRALELRVVAGAAAEELVLAGRRDGELLEEKRRRP